MTLRIKYLQRSIFADPVPDYVKAVVDTALKIHESDEPGDILAFLTGMEEVDRAVSLLNEYAKLVKEGKRECTAQCTRRDCKVHPICTRSG